MQLHDFLEKMRVMSTLVEKIESLPPDLQREVEDFVDFLHVKHRAEAPDQDWAGALAAYKEQYTSVDLQHRALDWWAGKD